MSENTQSKDQNSSEEEKKPLSLKTLQLRNPVARDQVRQSFSHGKTKTVEVEVKRKRLSVGDRPTDAGSRDRGKFASTRLTNDEFDARLKAVQDAMKSSNEKALDDIENVEEPSVVDDVVNVSVENTPVESVVVPTVVSEAPVVDMPTTEVPKAAAPPPRPVMRQMPKKKTITAEDITPIVLRADGYGKPKTPVKKPVLEAISDTTFVDNKTPHSKAPSKPVTEKRFSDDDDSAKSSPRQDPRKVVVPVKKAVDAFPKKLNRTTIHRALDGEGSAERTRSMASLKRARQKHKGAMVSQGDVGKSVREVIIPEILTVSELANRMAVRAADVVKSLMRMGMMVTINQTIDADTAELVCSEFGHKFKRVSDSDIETGLMGADDASDVLLPRAPIVTVMGHVDHGKTSLLDALRKTDVVSTEAGGITQHIGAYQVTLSSGQKITFIDTPGHAAFSEMRSRGANITDVVILVVAADDGIMEQTIEAINHARAAGVPVVVAINKMDKPGANIDRVKADLTNHGIVLEEYGGDVMAIGVSAKAGTNLDKLEEAILLQAEVLNLRANPNRRADGVIIEAKMDKGRGPVATVLVRRGTLRIGDIIVAGGEWGRVRALVNYHGKRTDEALPATPVEIVGFNGVPSAGDELVVVDDEAKAREIAEFRRQRERDRSSVVSSKSSIEAMMSKIAAGEAKELPLVIKTDVQGSLEAILTSLTKIGTDEVCARVLHGGVGGINESDVTLAKASSGIILGFNVRANNQARDLAKRDGVDIRYYSIIYDLLDEMKALMGGLLAPTLKENYLGTAEIREVHNITKVGKVAGCYVQEGVVKRGAKVRLLRDNVVIHEGALKTLRRFKDEVRDVKESYECGIALENYSDIRPGDKIECFEIESIARHL